jgi:hypothetical protein
MKLSEAIIGLFVMCWTIAPAWGQAPAGTIPGIEPGQTVTIHRDGGEKLKGAVVRVEDGSVVVNAGKKGGIIQVPNSDIVKIGRKSRGTGALIGLGIGFGVGAAIGASRAEYFDDFTKGASAMIAGGLYGGIGSAVGAAFGVDRTVYKRR